jgi:hypothetical protein
MNPAAAYLFVGVPATIWVAFDARRFEWGSNRFCDRAWKWVPGCLLLFVVAFPAYLWQRRKVPARALVPELQASPAVAGGPSPGGSLAVAVSSDVAAPAALPDEEPERGSLLLALLAGAAAAFVGGLVWAGVVIATRFDIGFLAWFVGAATGVAVARFAGAAGASKIVAGLLAAGGIVVGKYTIFVHDVRATSGDLLAQHGVPIGYLDSFQMGFFLHHFGGIVRPIYYLWIGLAFVGALRAAEGKSVLPRRFRR